MGSSTGIQLFDGMYQGLGDTLQLVQTRQQLTAANLANVDTPGYLAKQITPFGDLLGEIMDKGIAGDPLDLHARVGDSIEELAAPDFALDGNSVDVEREQATMEENKVMYQALVGGMSRRLAILRFAATDGKG